jgi:hypothetical protein
MADRRGAQPRDRRRRRIDGALRITAALFGTIPGALMLSVLLARVLPGDETVRFVIAYMLAIPIAVAAMCAVFLARSGARAWLLCASAALLLFVLVYHVHG